MLEDEFTRLFTPEDRQRALDRLTKYGWLLPE